MDTKNVRELIDEEMDFFRSWLYCSECMAIDEEMSDESIGAVTSPIEKLQQCLNCEDRYYQDIEGNFINVLIVNLVKAIKEIDHNPNKSADSITPEQLKLLKFLYQIYKDNPELMLKIPDKNVIDETEKIRKSQPPKNVKIID